MDNSDPFPLNDFFFLFVIVSHSHLSEIVHIPSGQGKKVINLMGMQMCCLYFLKRANKMLMQ